MAHTWEQSHQILPSVGSHRGGTWDPSSFEWDSWQMLAHPAEGSTGNLGSLSTVGQTLPANGGGIIKGNVSDSSYFRADGASASDTAFHGAPNGHPSALIQPEPNEEVSALASLFPDIDCPNLRAGRIPCACTEADALLLQRLQGRRAEILSSLLPPVCQVANCPVDLATLKEYHQRHRVCEDHAKAPTVLLYGVTQRYCQQCGRFHLLEDFDEGKRSCRGKLAHHNNRRRRKKNEQKGSNKELTDVGDDEQSPSSSCPEVKPATSEGGESFKDGKKTPGSKKTRKIITEEKSKETESKRRKRGKGLKDVLPSEEEKVVAEVLSSSNGEVHALLSGPTLSTSNAVGDMESMQVDSTSPMSQEVLVPSVPDLYGEGGPIKAKDESRYLQGILPSNYSVKVGNEMDTLFGEHMVTSWQPDAASPTGHSSASVVVKELSALQNSSCAPAHNSPETFFKPEVPCPLKNIFPTEQTPTGNLCSSSGVDSAPDLGMTSQLATTDHSLMALLFNGDVMDQPNAAVSASNSFLPCQTVLSQPPPIQPWSGPENPAYTPQNITGRMSFKLYDWNPGDFPRRLRHQIMEWLAQMPSDLEGYIRPGCTVLTVKTAIPSSAWVELERNLKSNLERLITGEGQNLFGIGRMLVQVKSHFAAVDDGAVINVAHLQEMDGPFLFSVRPLCVDAERATRVVIRGCNFRLPASRILCSIGGEYILQEPINAAYVGADCCVAEGPMEEEDVIEFSDSDDEVVTGHQENQNVPSSSLRRKIEDSFSFMLPKINNYERGSAHLEIEHGVGCSNHRPLLVADKHICAEVNTLALEIEDASKSESNRILQGGERADLSMKVNAAKYAALQVRVQKEQEIANFLDDFGWVLAGLNRQGHLNVDSPTEAVGGQDASGNGRIALERLRRLLNFAAQRGWPVVTRHLLHTVNMLNKDVFSKYFWSEFNGIQTVGVDRDGFSVLHGAVVAGHFALAETIISFGREHWTSAGRTGWWEATWQGPGGLTAIHLAALRSNGENFIHLLTSQCKEALSWTSARDVAGQTPRDYANFMGKSHLDIIVAKRLIANASVQLPTFVPSRPTHIQGKKGAECLDNAEVHVTMPELNGKSFSEKEPFLSKLQKSKSVCHGSNLIVNIKSNLKTNLKQTYWDYGLQDVAHTLNSCHREVRTVRRMGQNVTITVLTMLVACAGLCVLVAHPNEVKMISMSFRRCLSAWGVERPHV